MDKDTRSGCGCLIAILGLGALIVALVNRASPGVIWVSVAAIAVGLVIAVATTPSEKSAGQDAPRQHGSVSGMRGDRRPGSVRGILGQGRKFDAITFLQKRDGLTYKQALGVVEKLEAEREPPARVEEARSIPPNVRQAVVKRLEADREPPARVEEARSISPNVRQAVLDRDDYICRYCGRRSQTIEVDHVIPVSQGGTSTLGNLVASCRDCNRKKGGRKPEEAGMEVLPVRTRRRDRA